MISDKSQTESVYSVLSEAVVGIKKSDITEVKSLKSPPQRVKIIGAAISYVLDGQKKKIQSYDWKMIKAFLANARFLQRCATYDPAKFEKERLQVLESYMKKNQIDNEESMKISKNASMAIASLHQWLLMLIAEAKKEK